MRNHCISNMPFILLTVLAALLGCAKLEEKVSEALGSYELPQISEEEILSQAQSLLEQNQGKAVVTGVLTQEGILPGNLSKMTNAQGTSRMSNRAATPLADADVLFYDALRPSTQSAYRTQTDSTGAYYAVLDEGIYFAFAVKFDPLSQELITARVDNIQALIDTVVEIAEVTAIEDQLAPTIISVYDATSPDAGSGVFLLSGVPHQNTNINVVFSEPMDRNSSSGIVFGPMDTSAVSGAFALSDTLPADSVLKTWSGDNTVLNLSFLDSNFALSQGTQYGIILPTSLKDLARNALEQKFKVTFVPVDGSSATPFVIAETFPVDGGTIKPNQNPAVIFNRPPQIFSVLQAVSVTPALPGVWEIQGKKAMFKPGDPLTVGASLTLNVGTGAQDLNGRNIQTARAVNFSVVDFTGAAATTGSTGDIARVVEDVFDAFQQGDIASFSGYFHVNFRINENGAIQSRDQFIENIRESVAKKDNLYSGFPAPVFDTDTSACNDGIERWKVRSADSSTVLWVETAVPPGAGRRVYLDDGARTRVSPDSIQWNNQAPAFDYSGSTFQYDADFSQFSGPVTEEAANEDERFWGDLLMTTSTVELVEVKGTLIDEFEVDTGIVVTGDTARVVVRHKEIRNLTRSNFEPFRGCDLNAAGPDTSFGLLNFVMVNTNGSWLIIYVDATHELTPVDYSSPVDYNAAFQNFNSFMAIAPLELFSPVADAENVRDAQKRVGFSFEKVLDSAVGGYLIGFSEDPHYVTGRSPQGGLYFVRQPVGDTVSFVLDSVGKPIQGGKATAILRNVDELALPGWERTWFEAPLREMINHDSGFAGVYYWKAIALADTAAAQFLSNGFQPDRFFAESDFKFGPDYGHFSVGLFPTESQIEYIYSRQVPMGPADPSGGGFADSDLDGYPDQIETKYGTDPFNPSSFPDFTLDTDVDGMADFLEDMLDTAGLNLVGTAADSAGLQIQYQLLASKYQIVLVDSDGDNFPDDIEEMFGYDPFDPAHNPGTRARVTVPTGVFNGILAFGTDRTDIDFKILKDSTIRVGYTTVLGADTLRDTVRASFNESISELLFPVRFETGPDSGNSLLLRGYYDSYNSLFTGPMDRIPSVPRNSDAFGGGPYMGDWAATNRIGLDLEPYLGGGGGPVGPAPGFGYRFPPPGADTSWQFVFLQDSGIGNVLLVIDDFGDTVGAFSNAPSPDEGGHLNFHPQPDGGFDVDAHYFRNENMNHHSVNVFGKVFRWVDEADSLRPEYWVFDGQYNTIDEVCERVSSTDSTLCIQFDFTDVPGQFSAKTPLGSATLGSASVEGTFNGWAKQDEFGTGIGGPAGPDNDGDCVAEGTDPDDNNFDVPTPGGECHLGNFGAPPFLGTGQDFRTILLNTGVAQGDTFKIKIAGPETILESINDSTHVVKSHEFECGFVRIVPLDDSTGTLSDSLTGSQLILLEASPGVPAFDDKIKDDTGATIPGGAYITEMRPVTGPQCMGAGGPGGIPDADFDCVLQDVDPDDLNRDIPTPGGECGGPGVVIPPALQGNEDFITGSEALVPYMGTQAEFESLIKLYLGFSDTDPFADLNFPIYTVRGDMAMTFGGEFVPEDGKITHTHNFPFFSPSDKWYVVESMVRPGEPAIVINQQGPSIVLMAAPPNDDITNPLPFFRAPTFVVHDFSFEIFGSDSIPFHRVDSGAITATDHLRFITEPYHEFVLINNMPNLGTGGVAVVKASPMDPGRPAVTQDSTGLVGLVYSVTTRARLDSLSGGGPAPGDMDGDCVVGANDPDDNDFDVPFPGGNCLGGQDNDGDCVFGPADPDDTNPDVPNPGGACGAIGPELYRGAIALLQTELANAGGIVRLVAHETDPGIEITVGIGASIAQDSIDSTYSVTDPQDSLKSFVFVADGADPSRPMLLNAQLVVVDLSMMGGGPDNDGDCVPANQDPDDTDPDVPTAGGQCGAGPDNDGDCVFGPADPDDADPDVPTVGGECGGGPDPDNDSDCVPMSLDPDDADPDVPTVGGQCGGGPMGPPLFRGDIALLQTELSNANGIVRLVTSDTDPGTPVTVGATAPITQDTIDGTYFVINPQDSLKRFVFLADTLDPSLPLLGNGEPVVMDPAMMGGGPDNDGDCVFGPADPDDANPDIPTFGGQCGGGPDPDNDGDCVPASRDPDDTNPDLPTVGGEC